MIALLSSPDANYVAHIAITIAFAGVALTAIGMLYAELRRDILPYTRGADAQDVPPPGPMWLDVPTEAAPGLYFPHITFEGDR